MCTFIHMCRITYNINITSIFVYITFTCVNNTCYIYICISHSIIFFNLDIPLGATTHLPPPQLQWQEYKIFARIKIAHFLTQIVCTILAPKYLLHNLTSMESKQEKYVGTESKIIRDEYRFQDWDISERIPQTEFQKLI